MGEESDKLIGTGWGELVGGWNDNSMFEEQVVVFAAQFK